VAVTSTDQAISLRVASISVLVVVIFILAVLFLFPSLFVFLMWFPAKEGSGSQ